MNFRLVFAPSFEADVDRQISYLLEQHVSMQTINAWFSRLYLRLDALTIWPQIHPVDEAYSAELGWECRKINFGDYLVFYRVLQEQHEIRVVALIHGAGRR